MPYLGYTYTIMMSLSCDLTRTATHIDTNITSNGEVGAFEDQFSAPGLYTTSRLY